MKKKKLCQLFKTKQNSYKEKPIKQTDTAQEQNIEAEYLTKVKKNNKIKIIQKLQKD